MEKVLERCPWANHHQLLKDYHDSEWGFFCDDDQKQFEFLVLESAQAGLSWLTILQRRTAYKEAFSNFRAPQVAKFDYRKLNVLLQNDKIIRNKAKISAAINNAQKFLEIQKEFGSFTKYMLKFVGGSPIQNTYQKQEEIPSYTKESEKLSNDLKKRGFKFVGPTIIYAHMQASGIVNDHLVSCFQYEKCSKRGL